jgi:citrate synthase
LLDSELPDANRIAELRLRLGQARLRAFEGLPELGRALDAADGMDALRAALGHLVLDDAADPADQTLCVTGAMSVFAAAWHRKRTQPPLPPNPNLGHAADYLRMVHGTAPNAAQERALDQYLIAVIDHGLNASTFSARVVASTGSDLASAVCAAVATLKGPLHGGAPAPVLDMLDAIGTAEHAREWLEAELAAGRRLMGMGHRIYRVRDPRAALLERAILQLSDAGLPEARRRITLARAVEREAERLLAKRHPERALSTNVEFYTAVLLEALGFERSQFTPTFAAGRVAGWCAHYFEQRHTGRLIRPNARYVGPKHSSVAVPL